MLTGLAASNGTGLDARRQTFVPVGIYTIRSTIGWHARVLGNRRQGNTKTVVIVIVAIVVVRVEHPGISAIMPVTTA